MSQFIGIFTLPKDTTKGKSYFDLTQKQAVNLFKESITKKKPFIPEDENHSLADILSIFNKKISVRQIRNPFSEIIWSCYHQFHLQRFYPKASTSRL